MHDLLLEIGTEELPAFWVAPALEQLAQAVAERFRQENLQHQGIRTAGTPRRLAVILRGVMPRQPDSVVEVRGPAARQAFDSEGNYTSAAFGFARSQGIFPEDLKVKRVAGGEYLFVERPKPGLPTPEIAARLFPEIITGLTFPKRMRWGDETPRVGRPIRWLLALYGPEVIPFTLDGIVGGRTTYGHGFLSAGPVELPDASAYVARLAEANVMADPDARREAIRSQVEALAGAENAVLLEPDLLEEITFLVEQPAAFAGAFAPEFLDLPREALVLVMRKQQRYFPLADAEGRLLPRFIGVHDGSAGNLDGVRVSSERVLHARFADVRSFYQEDVQVPLPKRVPQLRRIVFQERLGTLYDKMERLQALCTFLADRWEIGPAARETLRRAVGLAKADLATRMMKELPELQGVVGRVYALAAGEPEAVADAIADHYRPRAAGDVLPPADVARILGVADRIDTLAGCFAIGRVPAGSQDPYALRRQAAGLVALLLEMPSLSLGESIARAHALYGRRGSGWRSLDVTQATLLDFIRQRLENTFDARGVRYDTRDAVLDAGFDDLPASVARALALDAVRDGGPSLGEKGPALLAAGIRVGNMIRFAARSDMAPPPGDVRFDLLEEEAEQALAGAYLEARPAVAQAAAAGDYPGVLGALSTLAEPIDAFFDTILVMSDEEGLRENRLRLLAEIQALFLVVADFTRLVIEE